MIDKPAWSWHKVLPDRTVKMKQRQDNVQFAAMVTAIDESLGRIVAKLKSLKLDDNTIIVFFPAMIEEQKLAFGEYYIARSWSQELEH